MEEKINKYLAPYHWTIDGFYKRRYERPVRLILDQFDKSDIVLDAGCGDGRLTVMIAPRVKSMLGIDHQKLPLEFATLIFKELDIKNTKFQVGDITKLSKFRSNSFTKITCFDVIEHIPKEKANEAIKQFARILKKDGTIYLTTPNREELFGRVFGHKFLDKHYWEYSVKELVKMFEPYFSDINVNGNYIHLIPRTGRYPDVFPFKSIFNFLIKAGLNKPTWSFGILIQGRRKDVI